jgi:hypothetical protein
VFFVLPFPFVIASLRLQIFFWTIFMFPSQGFFNAWIYFDSTMRKPRRSTITIEQTTTRFSSFFTPAFRKSGSFRRLFSRRRSTVIAGPIVPVAVVACVTQEVEVKEDPDVEQIERNGATEESRMLSDPVGISLSTISEANLEH